MASLARTVPSLARIVPSLARTVLKPSVLPQRGTRRQRQLVVTDGGGWWMVDGGSKKSSLISLKIRTSIVPPKIIFKYLGLSEKTFLCV